MTDNSISGRARWHGAFSEDRFEPFRLRGFIFKRADSAEEFDQIHRLNHETFVDEVGQYKDDGSGYLVDKFDYKNVYLVCKLNGDTVGMLAVHDQPPFAVASRLESPEVLERLCRRPLEVRLAAVKPDYRNSVALTGLIYIVYRVGRSNGYTHPIISGITHKVALYEKMGFRALGPPSVSGRAAFIPMALALDDVPGARLRMAARIDRELGRPYAPATLTTRLLPGPPVISPGVRAAFRRAPLYHRSPEFIALFEQVRERLAALAGGDKQVALLNGSGTLANDSLAACLRADPHTTRGLVLVNGEFGERIVKQARRAGLRFLVLSWEWGETWDLEQVERTLVAEPGVGWIWGVHQESSTGVLNDGEGLVAVARRHERRVYLDAVSSFGAVPIPSGVAVATGVSGKSLGSYPGVSFVCARPGALAGARSEEMAAYLDLPRALATIGPLFTFPSAPVCALHRALDEYRDDTARRRRYEGYARLGRYVRSRLRGSGLESLAAEETAAPVITTFAPPPGMSSDEFLGACRSWGFWLAGDSAYLRARNYVQIGTMGDVDEATLARFFDNLDEKIGPTSKSLPSATSS